MPKNTKYFTHKRIFSCIICVNFKTISVMGCLWYFMCCIYLFVFCVTLDASICFCCSYSFFSLYLFDVRSGEGFLVACMRSRSGWSIPNKVRRSSVNVFFVNNLFKNRKFIYTWFNNFLSFSLLLLCLYSTLFLCIVATFVVIRFPSNSNILFRMCTYQLVRFRLCSTN